jgi:hypothetical protein
MDRDPRAAGPPDPLTDLAGFAVMLHEMYEAFVAGGFDASQALYLVGCQLRRPSTPE